MSTKTTFKRIALVTVAALGFGVMSVVPSTATVNSDSLTLSAATSAQTTAETSTATSATVTLQFLSSQATDSMSVVASLVSGPASSLALPRLSLVETTSARVKNNATDITDLAAAGAGGAVIDSNVKSFARPFTGSDVAQIVKAKYRVYVGLASNAAPTVVGTYVVKITPAISDGNGGTLNGTAQTVTITVTNDTNLETVASAALSTSIINAGDTISATVDATVDAVRTIGSAPAASIKITQLNAAGRGLGTSVGESLTVIITGPGSIATGAFTGSTISLSKTGARALTMKNGDFVQVFADGSAGTATVTFSNAAGTVIATESLTFYSTVTAKLTAVVGKAFVLAGGATNADGSAASSATVTNTRVFRINAADADGRGMANGAGSITAKPTVATTDGLIGAAGVCTYAARTTLTAAGYYCSAPGVSAAKFGKVNYTFTATNADLTTVTTTADVTFSDYVATSLTITGPASAAIGEEITLTLTAKDKNGFPVADTSYEGAATNRAFWDSIVNSNSSFAPFGVGETITTVSGVATKKLYLPIAGGTVKTTWTTTGTAGVASGGLAKTLTETDIVYSVTVVNAGVDEATAAAEEARAAAEDATDAALSAAEAAEEATAAVAELSASVSKLISALRAQITTLTNLVVKIQKKVKA
jgi:hypothetical protein